MTLALIPITIRFWLRYKDSKKQPWTRNLSDGLVVLSWLSGIVLISINTWKNTLRYRYVNYPPSELYYSVPRPLSAHLLYVSWVSLFFIYISLWATKFALLAFYTSLLQLMDTRAARAMLALTTLFTAVTLALHVGLLTRWCDPVSSNWNVDGQLCSAVHDIRSVTVSTVANVVTDLAIVTLPLFALASLGRERRRALTTAERGMGSNRPQGFTRAEVSAFVFVLLMAALSITAALTRWVTLWLVKDVPKANITHTIDVWALVEIVASLLAVCLPSLRTLGRRGRTRREAGDSEGRRRGAANKDKEYNSLESAGTQSSRGGILGYDL
jgi:hypothetical protein